MTANSRLIRCRQEMKTHGFDHLIVSTAVNLFYLTGEWIESGERLMTLMVSPSNKPKLLIHQMFQHEVSGIQDVEIVFWKDDQNPMDLLANMLGENSQVGIDKYWPSHFLISLMKLKPSVKWSSASAVIDELRQIKTVEELDTLRQSAAIADRVMNRLIQADQFPSTEGQLVERMQQYFKEEGVKRFSFSPIIGFGENSAVPHHATSDRMSEGEHAVLIDMGGRYQEYCSDMTRTFYLGKPNDRFKEIYNIVLEAQLAAIAKVKPGALASDIDRAAREVIEQAGYGEYFTHRTGHGLGIEIHEEPYITGSNPQTLREGMVFSIEPGIYLPGEFGVRIEDIVVVTNDGVELLNKVNKEPLFVTK
jgi:Xaa-Pro dipeptidase